MRRTKIICTTGPASASPESLEKLIVAGMDVARINFSHGTQREHGKVIKDVREIASRLGRPVAILQDLAGLKIRIGKVAEGTMTLAPGRAFVLTTRDVPGDEQAVSVTYGGLPDLVRPGDPLLLSDGALELRVEEVTKQDILCRVVIGGDLCSSKGINVPTRSVKASGLTQKDSSDLAYGLKQGIDFVAVSFVRTADDIHEARRVVTEAGQHVPVIAKIEKHEAVANIDEILEVVDGIMIARGDLGVEIPIERVPGVQKRLIEKANGMAKPVITATQMLKSMVESPRPTRAEASDVANAVLDGSDGIMLSEETAIGRFPVETVSVMSRIAREAEADFPSQSWLMKFEPPAGSPVQDTIAHMACRTATKVEASAIVTCTQSGSTARLVSRYRPSLSILAATPDEEVYRSLAMVWGVVPIKCDLSCCSEFPGKPAVELALQSGLVQPGQTIVVVAGLPIQQPGNTNLIMVVRADTP